MRTISFAFLRRFHQCRFPAVCHLVRFAFIVTCSIIVTDALANEQRLPRSDFAQYRPANFYQMHYNQMPEICTPVLSSLNKEYRNGPNDKAMILQNEFLVKTWKEGRFSWKLADGRVVTRSWDVAIVDLNNDGVSEGIFLDRHSLRGNEFEILYVESPAKGDVVVGATLSRKRAKEITSKRDEWATSVHVKSRWTTPKNRDLINLDDLSFFDLVTIKGRHFILTSDAFSQISQNRYLKVTLIEYKNPKDFVIQCQFRARTTVYVD